MTKIRTTRTDFGNGKSSTNGLCFFSSPGAGVSGCCVTGLESCHITVVEGGDGLVRPNTTIDSARTKNKATPVMPTTLLSFDFDTEEVLTAAVMAITRNPRSDER